MSLDAALGLDARPAAASDGARQALVDSWPKVSSNLSAAIDARAKERQESLERALQRRQKDEETRTIALLDAVEGALTSAISNQSDPQQLSFADLEPDERQQLTADRAAWQERLDRLPKEREEELARVAERYSRVDFFTFPAAVVHLVPAGTDR